MCGRREGCAVGVTANGKVWQPMGLQCERGSRWGCAAQVAAEWLQLRGCNAQWAAKGCAVLQWWRPRGCTAQVAAESCTVSQWWQ